ncbi:GNAT family N-acetyltransferase [Nonomuraea rhizosphaerae]|uniref:GNAT family N-acetyltransferase n=1 Tax=Nonomuraea rhizosphaerae TaxID=2665663 RepID=UPI001FE787AC|nr:GNAT family N-acetyltransferase [Nonomuraea rhizosphaerae]
MAKVTVVLPGDLGSSETAKWRDMQRALPHLANPFLSPEFVTAMGQVRPGSRVAVIEDGDGIAGFFPFERHGGAGEAIGAWVSLCQGIVHRPGAEFDVPELLKACGLHVWEFGCLVAGQPWFQPYVTLEQQAVILDLADGYPVYEARLKERSPKFLKTTRYKERKLARDAGEVTSVFAVTADDQLRLLREWKSAQYVRSGRPDRFGQEWVVELVERLHAIDTKEFGGVLSMLYAGGKPVAGHFGLRSESVLIGWFPSYDPAWSKYSPGLIQHLRMAEAAAGMGITSVDLSIGAGYEYKDALRSRNVPVSEGIVRRRTAGAAAHWVRTAPVRRARRVILDVPFLYRMADKAMRRYGRLRSGAGR